MLLSLLGVLIVIGLIITILAFIIGLFTDPGAALEIAAGTCIMYVVLGLATGLCMGLLYFAGQRLLPQAGMSLASPYLRWPLIMLAGLLAGWVWQRYWHYRQRRHLLQFSGSNNGVTDAVALEAGIYRLAYAFFSPKAPVELLALELASGERQRLLKLRGSGSTTFQVEEAGKFIFEVKGSPREDYFSWRFSLEQLSPPAAPAEKPKRQHYADFFYDEDAPDQGDGGAMAAR